jgi:predicted transcriptional regulator
LTWLEEHWKTVLGLLTGGIASGFGLRYVLDFIVRRRKAADEGHISFLQVSEQTARDWMKSASDASRLLMEAHRKLLASEDCLRDCIRIMRACDVNQEEVDAIETRINKIHATAE